MKHSKKKAMLAVGSASLPRRAPPSRVSCSSMWRNGMPTRACILILSGILILALLAALPNVDMSILASSMRFAFPQNANVTLSAATTEHESVGQAAVPAVTVSAEAVPEDEAPSGAPAARRFGAANCTFTRCRHQELGIPYVTLLVPFRNRLDNLARLVSSIHNATQDALDIRACTCIMVIDFNTQPEVLPPWKNPRCLATLHESYGVYLTEEVLHARAHRNDDELRAMIAEAPTCRSTPFVGHDVSEPPLDNAAARRGIRVTARGLPDVHGFPRPLHVDISGLNGRDAIAHILSLYDGDSEIVDGLSAVGGPVTGIKFSRGGGLFYGIQAAAQRSPPNASIVFACDADLMVRPGFFQKLVATPKANSSVYLPAVWSTCFGAGLNALPDTSTRVNDGTGHWIDGGFGMVGAFMSDMIEVAAYNVSRYQSWWGFEDVQLKMDFETRRALVREHTPELIHPYHSRVKDWGNSVDGMTGTGSKLGMLVQHICSYGHCPCPLGTSKEEVHARLQRMAKYGQVQATAQEIDAMLWWDRRRQRRLRGGGAAQIGGDGEFHDVDE